MRKLGKATFGALALMTASAAMAANYSWTQSLTGPSVYADQSENSNFFATPSTVPATGAKVTTISWGYGRYNNGSTLQQVKICYATRYSNDYAKCINISTSATGTTSYFSGDDAKGKFKMTFVLTGGTYPASAGFQNSLLVNYTAP